MKELILILLFGKSLLLTQHNVDITNNWLEINPDKPLIAITGGASINIKISIEDKRIIGLRGSENIIGELTKIFPSDIVYAELIKDDGSHIELSRRIISVSDFSLTKEDSVYILLTSDRSLPVDESYKSVRLKSNYGLKNVKIYWKNFSE